MSQNNTLELIQHLENLQNQGSTSVTLNVDHLLDVLRASLSNKKGPTGIKFTPPKNMSVDGGEFGVDLD